MRIQNVFNGVIAFIYLALYYLFDQQVSQISPYAMYAIEAILVSVSLILNRKQISLAIKEPKKFGLGFGFALIFGMVVYQGLSVIKAEVPFDFSAKEIIVLLLFVGPLLEEGIYRWLFWIPIKAVLKNDALVIAATSLLFSLAHLVVLPAVPEAYRLFVLYQSFYVLFLGVFLGFFRVLNQSILSPLALHFSFNLGFLIVAHL